MADSKKAYGQGQSAGVSASPNEKTESSAGRKVAAAAGIAGLAAVGGTIYAGCKTHAVVDRIGKDVAGAVGAALMHGAGPLDRRIPAIGAPDPEKEDDCGFDF